MARNFSAHIRAKGKLARPAGECVCCDKAATHWVRIAYTYMRGEDEVENVCQRHLSMATGQLDRFFGQMRSKPRFIASLTEPNREAP